MAVIDKAFGERFKIAFDYASNQKIADKLGITAPAVQNYKEGRIPDGEKLQIIAAVTNCDLHWLLTGDYRKSSEVNETAEINSITDEDIEEWEYSATNVEPSEKFFVETFRETVVGIIRDTVPSIIENYLALERGERLTRNSKIIKPQNVSDSLHFGNKGGKVKRENLDREIDKMKDDPTDE